MKDFLLLFGGVIVFVIYRFICLKKNPDCLCNEPMMDIVFAKVDEKQIKCPECGTINCYYDNLKEINVCMDCDNQWK